MSQQYLDQMALRGKHRHMMERKRVNELVSVITSCAIMVHFDRTHFKKKSADEICDYIREQLTLCGFTVKPIGLQHVVVTVDDFEVIT